MTVTPNIPEADAPPTQCGQEPPQVDDASAEHQAKTRDGNDILREHGREAVRAASDQADVFKGASAPSLSRPTIILRLDDWLKRDLPKPDCLMGHWLTTTTRALLSAPTGIGKSMWGIGLGMRAADGLQFLHWNGVRKAKVFYADGEMSRRLFKERLAGEVERIGHQPAGFFAFSHEDLEDFAPLNTPRGQAQIEGLIAEIGGVDLIIFDNIMSLIAGDMRDEESWRQTLPWIRKLTARRIGQLWIHHTGYDEKHGYGTSTREWQLDTSLLLERVLRDDTDVSFKLKFQKARERTPANRRDFSEINIALINNAWAWKSSDGGTAGNISPKAGLFLKALRDATIGSQASKMNGCPAATIEEWQTECVKQGLVDLEKPNSARSQLSKYKLELKAAHRIGCNETLAWTLG